MTYEKACEVICAVHDSDRATFANATRSLGRSDLYQLVALLAAMVPTDSHTPASVVEARARVCRLRDAVPDPTGDALANVTEQVTALYDVRPADVFSPSQRQDHIDARHVLCWIASRVLKMSHSEIGRRVGRDHTSVINAVRRVDREQRLRVRAAMVTAAISTGDAA